METVDPSFISSSKEIPTEGFVTTDWLYTTSPIEFVTVTWTVPKLVENSNNKSLLLSSSHPWMGSSEVDVLTRLLKFPLNSTFFFAKQGSEIVRINIRLPNFLIVSISFCFWIFDKGAGLFWKRQKRVRRDMDKDWFIWTSFVKCYLSVKYRIRTWRLNSCIFRYFLDNKFTNTRFWIGQF